MMRYLFIWLWILVAAQAWADAQPPEALELAKADVNPKNVRSIKRGAKFFANTCMSCHTLIYLRYNKIAEDAGITLDKMPINVKDWPFGVKPPDLSLEADIRGVDWIYTYLHSFYKDPTRPTGVNNLLVRNTSMPGIMAPYQGDQVLVENPMLDLLHHVQWYDLLKLERQGTMTPEEFDDTVLDLVNFLDYAAEPFKAEQEKIGYWVLGFLVILFVLMYKLKKEYWKDVKLHKTKE